MCVTRATISGVTNGSEIDADTVINCTADVNAYPRAEYRWSNNGVVQLTGQEFELTPGTEYKLTCMASNNFNRQGCSATSYVEFNSKLTLCCTFPLCFVT